MPGLVDDAHAAAAEHRLHVIAGDPRELAARPRRRHRAVIGGLRAGTTRRPPPRRRAAVATSTADLAAATRGRRGRPPPACARVEDSSSSRSTRGSPAMAGSPRTFRSVGTGQGVSGDADRPASPMPRTPLRAGSTQVGRRSSSCSVRSSRDRFSRRCTVLVETPSISRRLDLRHPLDAHQVEDLALVPAGRRSPPACGGPPA